MNNLINFITPQHDFYGKKAFIALGVFDGVHPGHCAVVQNAAAWAKKLGAAAGAVTFVPHPRQVLAPEEAPQLLVPVAKRVELLLQSGADFVACVNFSPEIAAWQPEFFLEKLIGDPAFQTVGISVGYRWKFGRNGAGDQKLISDFAARKGLIFSPVQEICRQERIVSSSLIRQLIAAGDIEQAADMWQHPVMICGRVVKGMQLAGTELEAPTANIIPDEELLVPDGVYAGKADAAGKSYAAVINIGPAPTYQLCQRRVEVHLLGFNGDLYGQNLEIELRKRLRDIRRFDSPEQLREQIKMDVKYASAIVK